MIALIGKEKSPLMEVHSKLESTGFKFDTFLKNNDWFPFRITYPLLILVISDVEDPLLRSVLENCSHNAYIAIASLNLDLVDMVKLLKHPNIHHVTSGENMADDLLSIANKVVIGDLFGVEKYLESDAIVTRKRLTTFQGRGDAIDEVLSYAEESSVRRKVRISIGQACEELLMNALYDAPVDEDGNQIFAHVEPHARVNMESPKPVTVRYALQGNEFLISVRDRYGMLKKEVVLAFIEKCLFSDNQIDRKTYGAGLGIYLIVNACNRFIVNIADGMTTEVICSFDLKKRSPLRLISIFQHVEHTEE